MSNRFSRAMATRDGVRRAYELQLQPDEDDWLDEVLAIAADLGWQRRYHTHDSRRSTPGFPDLVLVHPGHRRVVFAELKSRDGRLTVEQAGWVNDLRACGQEAYVWRPADRDQVDYVLARRTPPLEVKEVSW